MIILDSNGQPYRRTVVFDVETTGLYPEAGNRIIEIGAVALDEKSIVDEFHSLIYVERPIDPEAQRVHGIAKKYWWGSRALKK
jgi:DNA polymerase III subunit epsilon